MYISYSNYSETYVLHYLLQIIIKTTNYHFNPLSPKNMTSINKGYNLNREELVKK